MRSGRIALVSTLLLCCLAADLAFAAAARPERRISTAAKRKAPAKRVVRVPSPAPGTVEAEIATRVAAWSAASDSDSVRIALRVYYNRHHFAPAWTSDGVPRATADQLIQSVRTCGEMGLDPSDFPLQALEDRVKDGHNGRLDAAGAAELDVLATDTFLRLASQVVGGRVHPQDLFADLHTRPREFDTVALLERAQGEGDVPEALASLEPPQAGYRSLKRIYIAYRAIAAKGGWGKMSDGDRLLLGTKSPRVIELRKRLVASGDLDKKKAKGNRYDPALADAVRSFQDRNGLAATGEVDSATVELLNLPVEERLREMELNLERWRWVPGDFGSFYVSVNIPEFRLRVVQDGRTVDSMKVIVGRYYHPTPMFDDRISSIVFNPTWAVPANIARDEILPVLHRDSTYLQKQKIRVFQGSGPNAKEIDPATIVWSEKMAADFPYTLIQDPGPDNPLGKMKFLFPNPYDVYLHDTPAAQLFTESRRDFSYGCVRVERPYDLARDLLDPAVWTHERIDSLLAVGTTESWKVDPSVPIYLLYWTVWADGDGKPAFRDDVYRIDFRHNWAWKQRDKALGKVASSAADTLYAPTRAAER